MLALLTTTNSYTRNDGPLSVRRAYRPNEVRQLAERAGLVEEARYRALPGVSLRAHIPPREDK